MDFVVGHPRSGTRFFSELLNASGARVSAHELLINVEFQEPIEPERQARRLGGAALVALASRYYEGTYPSAKISALFDHYRREGPLRVDCNWKLTWVLPPLLQRFPKARFVHLTRSPGDNIRSTYNLGYYGDFTEREGARELLAGWTAHWYESMPELPVPGWTRLSSFEKNCAFWSESHRLIRTALGGGAECHRVRYEDLSDDRVVADACAFLRISVPTARQLAKVRGTRVNAMEAERRLIDRFQSDFLPAYETWTENQKSGLRDRCGDMAAALGYRV